MSLSNEKPAHLEGDAPPAPRNLAQQAYQALSRMIRERELRSGDPIVEQHLAERLGVSRTPLREALQRLEGEELLQKHPGRSYEVRKVELREYLQSLKVREVLEPEAAVLAIPRISADEIEAVRTEARRVEHTVPYDKIEHWRADDLVHSLFIRNCANDVMAETLVSLRVTTQLFEIDRLADRLGPDSREHEAILDALAAQDPKAVRKAVATHIRSLVRFALKAVS